VAVLPVTAFLLLAAALGMWSRRADSWKDWAPATCLPDSCFCEAVGSGTVVQPANAWSSLAFALAGLWIAYPSTGGPHKARNRMASQPAYRVLYGCAMAVIGLGSYFYHASLSFAGQVCDMSGMYLLISFALVYGVARRTRIQTGIAMLAYLVLNAALLRFQMTFPDLRRYVFAALVAAVLGVEIRYRGDSRVTIDGRWLGRAAGTMGLAFAVWVLDITKAVCSPHSVLQGHALWHILGALAGWCLYRYYESEVTFAAQTPTPMWPK
jgi:Ceramidase